jgi:hypothetical protein
MFWKNRKRLKPEQVKLVAPDSYFSAPPEVIEAVVNGCGAATSKFDFVPDTMWGLSIQPACNIHDWDYHEGETWQDKHRADERFLINLIRIIRVCSRGPLRIPRYLRAIKYYIAVDILGADAFFSGKQKPEKGAITNG